MDRTIDIRPLRDDDSFEAITALLHRAYKQDGTLVAECRRQTLMRLRPP